jgi:2-oxoisovalerate dehydrogenase E2 component (dihydrolipoyl transacylase)
MFILSNLAKSPLLAHSRILFMSRYAFGLLKFNLPDLGEKIKEGTIKKLYVKEGDTVEEFQKLADVASDKQFTELTASDSGVIKKIYYREEEVCQVGDLFLEILVPE